MKSLCIILYSKLKGVELKFLRLYREGCLSHTAYCAEDNARRVFSYVFFILVPKGTKTMIVTQRWERAGLTDTLSWKSWCSIGHSDMPSAGFTLIWNAIHCVFPPFNNWHLSLLSQNNVSQHLFSPGFLTFHLETCVLKHTTHKHTLAHKHTNEHASIYWSVIPKLPFTSAFFFTFLPWSSSKFLSLVPSPLLCLPCLMASFPRIPSQGSATSSLFRVLVSLLSLQLS